MVCAAAASTMGVLISWALVPSTVMAVPGVAVPKVNELPRDGESRSTSVEGDGVER